MIDINKYSPIVKTGDAEFTALKGLGENVKERMIPIFEITRGRKAKNDKEGSIAKRIKQLKIVYGGHRFIMDLTSEHDLLNNEIKELYTTENGYQKWVDFCFNQKLNFSKMYPVIQMQEETSYDSYIQNVSSQVTKLLEKFDYIVFRASEANAKKIMADIFFLISSKKFSKLEERIIFILDYDFINDSISGSDNAVSLIKYLKIKLNINNVILAATSFPSNVFNIFKENQNSAVIDIKEIDFFNNINQRLSDERKIGLNLIYGDYALINPKRNDGVTMTRGWIPRMDVPSMDAKVYLERERRTKTFIGKNDEGKSIYEYGRYIDAYERLAEKVIAKPFFHELNSFNYWGVQEILRAANGIVSSSSPSFWIAVRMNIHINLTIRKFYPF